MAISKVDILNKINIALGSATSAIDIASLLQAKSVIESVKYSVADLASLPAASENTGRMIWVESIGDYRVSNGEIWGRKFDSVTETVADIMAWGQNGDGQLGDNSIINKSSPASVVGGFTDWVRVATGNFHNIAIRTNGTAWTWGQNSVGELGDNTSISKSSPVSVVGGFTDWTKINAGFYHSLAIRSNGSLWAWGRGAEGQLGDNSSVSKSSPVSVVGGFTDWCQVDGGRHHTLALRTNGTLWAWGSGSYGMLGDGTYVNKSSPVSVVGGFTDWSQASAGGQHSVAIRTNGTMWAWGRGLSGTLGNNGVANNASPVSVVGGFTDWCQVSAGWGHSAAVRTNGTIWTWGDNWGGKLGTGDTVSRSSPVSVVGGFTDWCQVSSGPDRVSALRTNGTIWGWGYNENSKLGDGTTTNKSSPVSVVGGFTNWCQVSSGYMHTIALKFKNVGF